MEADLLDRIRHSDLLEKRIEFDSLEGHSEDPLERFGDSFHVGYGSTRPERIREVMAILGRCL